MRSSSPNTMPVIAQILERRESVRTTCATVPTVSTESPHQTADRVAALHGLRPLGEGWLEISGQDALVIVTAVLHRDLAYGTEVMPLAQAQELATEFLDLAPEPHMYFSNGNWAEAFAVGELTASSVGFDPISDSTFDAGVICVGDGMASIVWVEDED